MTVAFDAFSSSAAGTGNLSWTHTPVGTPRGVIVLVVRTGDDPEGPSVTYGGVAMNGTGNTPVVNLLGEFGVVQCYILGSGIPTGAQTVVVNTVGMNATKRAVAITVTAAADTEFVSEQFVSSNSLANPSVVLGLLGRTCFVAEGFFSGQNAVTGITPRTGWTSMLEHDFGTQTAGWYRYNTIGSADVTTGWTQTADDAVMISVAISEVQAGQTIGPAGAIGSGEAFGTNKLNLALLSVGAIPSAQVFGTAQIHRSLGPAGAIASAELFGSTLVIGPQTVGPAGAITSAEAFGAGKLNRTLGPAGGIPSAETFGAAKLNLILRLLGIASAESIGVLTVIIDQTVGPAGGIASGEALGSSQLNRSLGPAGAITSAEALGAAKLNLILRLTALASAEQFGTTSVILDQFIGPAGAIASAEAFGAARVTLLLNPTAIASAEAFGMPGLHRRISTIAIASVEAFGTARTVLVVGPAGISTAEIVNAARVGFILAPSGVGSAQAFGAVVVLGAGQIIGPIGLASSEVFGILMVDTWQFGQVLEMLGITVKGPTLQ